MAKPISISTKKGDAGESYLASGEKLSKSDFVFEVLGTLDELNSHIGLVVAELNATVLSDKEKIVEELEDVQKNIYLLSSIVASAQNIRFSKTKLTQIEKLGDALQSEMAEGWTTKFLYPGGSVIGAQLDIARCVCRRLERVLVAYSQESKLKPIVLQYVNRLSDFLFIIRCYVNLHFGVVEKQFSQSKK